MVGAIISAITLYKIFPPLTQTGYFTEFGAGYMIGNLILFCGGLVLMAIAWKRRKAS
jgi:hypothetical protein